MTRCVVCDRSWTSTREAHCVRCHRHFGGPSGFDRHLHHPAGWETLPPADALICRDPATLKPRSDGTPVLVADPDGIWRDPGAARRLRGDGEIPGQLVFDDA